VGTAVLIATRAADPKSRARAFADALDAYAQHPEWRAQERVERAAAGLAEAAKKLDSVEGYKVSIDAARQAAAAPRTTRPQIRQWACEWRAWRES
jgi:hypothetical protein